ncbi:MAG TPA: hypothetical protein VFY10_09650 [Dehalococcoidia bacterium]|nr:hypothetical protein [Dehalococcoidia bacterium]
MSTERAADTHIDMEEGSIFLLQDDNKSLVPMNNRAYDSEDLLQTLLADYPDLLAGEQMNRSAPRKWLLVQREAGVPSRESGAYQWSMDHLFLDQDGIPTIVEVKRSSDTRIRREVVGQILDYAANAVVYWPAGRIREMFEETRRANPKDADVFFTSLSDSMPGREPELTLEDFWVKVDRNLRERRVRLVFVADLIPPELQRIVEFLNEQMKFTEVLGVEIKQYVGRGGKILVPRVFGLTAVATGQQDGSSPRIQWDRSRFMQDVESRLGEEGVRLAERISAWSENHEWGITWGSGAVDGSMKPYFALDDKRIVPFYINTGGVGYVQFGVLPSPFDTEEKRDKIRERLGLIPGLRLSSANGWPSFQMSALYDSSNLKDFLDIFLSVESEFKSSSSIG